MEDRKHHELSPSNYSAWAECPFWTGDGRQSSESSEGSRIHDEFRRVLEAKGGVETDSKVADWAARVVLGLSCGSVVSCEARVEGSVPLRDGTVEKGVFGYADALWIDLPANTIHVADLKSFSDGTTDYSPQLMGYAALAASMFGLAGIGVHTASLHVLHGGVFRCETIERTVEECVLRTGGIIMSRIDRIESEPTLCKWCRFCANVADCRATNGAMQTVSDNAPSFSRLSLCQKLVVCDAVVKLAETLKEQAKEIADNSPDKAIEMDGIRYEFRPWAGTPVCRDIGALAGAVYGKGGRLIITETDRRGTERSLDCEGLSPEEFIALCNVSKSKVVAAIMAKNADNDALKKAQVDRLVSQFFEKTSGTPHFVRTR